jgi:hypothetical protein
MIRAMSSLSLAIASHPNFFYFENHFCIEKLRGKRRAVNGFSSAALRPDMYRIFAVILRAIRPPSAGFAGQFDAPGLA